MNSTAAIAELAGSLRSQSENTAGLAITIDLLTVVAMFLRNLLILAIFARAAVTSAVGPLILMIVTAGICIWLQHKHGQTNIGPLQLSSPLSLPKVFRFGLIFLVIEILGSLGQKYLGHFGFLLVSVIGGLVSSASTAGAAATLAMHNSIDTRTAGLAVVLTSITSALSNLPLLHQEIREWAVTRRVTLVSCIIVGVGFTTMLVIREFWGR